MPSTRERVPSQTSNEINRRIRYIMVCNVGYYSEHKDQIPQRLRELDEEWDIERAIEANAATIGFFGRAIMKLYPGDGGRPPGLPASARKKPA
jgi:hypothetical protein